MRCDANICFGSQRGCFDCEPATPEKLSWTMVHVLGANRQRAITTSGERDSGCGYPEGEFASLLLATCSLITERTGKSLRCLYVDMNTSEIGEPPRPNATFVMRSGAFVIASARQHGTRGERKSSYRYPLAID